MPIFEYKCADCKSSFETLIANFEEKINCPGCQSANLERLYSPFGVKSGNEISPQTASPTSGCGCTPQSCGCMAMH